jgi:hypothetical protein
VESSSCPTNLSARGRRQRLVLGWAMGLVAAATIWLFHANDVARPLRLLVFVPLFASALGFLQAAAST